MIIRKLSNLCKEYDEIDSTNEEMSRLASVEDLAEGTIILADYQSAGRGHAGNRWESEKGSNLLFSMLLKPDFLSADLAFHLSRITSLALYEIIDNQCDDVYIKWPNDILVKGRKLAGILIENAIINNSFMHGILGIGINVNQTSFDPSIPAPTSLMIEKGCHIDRKSLLEDFRSSMERWYNTLVSGHDDMIMDSYTQKLYQLGVAAEYRSADGLFTGVIKDVLATGQLLMESGNGDILTFGFKEVEYH